MVNYNWSQGKLLRAEAKGFSKGSSYISPYIMTQIIIQTLSISKNNTSSIILPGWAILTDLISILPLQLGLCFQILKNPVFTQLSFY